jgi:hypothetical protein
MAATTNRAPQLMFITAALILGACADPAAPDDPSSLARTVARLSVVSGDSQRAPQGAAILLPLRVRATDAFDNPLPGVSVQFEISSGNGVISGSRAVTDAGGVATSGAWTLGSTEGRQQVIARAAGYEAAFTAFAEGPDPHQPAAGAGLVFVRDGAIWQSTDSNPRLLLHPANGIYAAAISRGGSIAFVAGGTNRMCIVAADDSEPRCVETGHASISGLDWSPNGAEVLFSGQPVTLCGSLLCYPPRKYLLALDAGSMSMRPIVTDVPDGSYAMGASWSRDGAVIAFAMRGGIWLVNADGSQRRELRSEVGGSYDVRAVRWSPDGSKLALSLEDRNNCPWFCDTAVGTVEADGSGLRVLASASEWRAEFVGGWPHGAPVWSHDGQKIAFGRSDCSASWNPCRETVYVITPTGGFARTLMENASLLLWRDG